MNIHIDGELQKSLSFVWGNENFVSVATQAEADLILASTAPTPYGKSTPLFIIISDKHNVDQIGIICRAPHRDRLRGFFLKRDIQANQEMFMETLQEVVQECRRLDDLRAQAHGIISRKEYIDIASLVEVGKAGNGTTQRFTSLFVDRPMLKLTAKITGILDALKETADTLNNQHKDTISLIRKNKILSKGAYDQSLLNMLEKSPGIRIEPVLLTGETGVGKTLVARWMHEQSGLLGTLQEVNASGLSPTLLESELFGHVKGAFTDAKEDKAGKALLAYGGVLFLDEIGDLPLELQPRIMKFIEEQCFTPEGWSRTNQLYTPVFIIAATNKNLEEEVRKGTFRRDLYARFRHRIRVPSIEERKGSLHVLIDLLLQQFTKGEIKYIANSTIERFRSIVYEDNFRGLERTVREAADETRGLGLEIILPEVVQ